MNTETARCRTCRKGIVYDYLDGWQHFDHLQDYHLPRPHQTGWERPLAYVLLGLAALVLVLGVVGPLLPASGAPASTTCNPQPTWSYRSPATTFGSARVWVFGDSITVQTARWLQVPGVAVDGYSGRTTAEGLDALAQLQATGRHRPAVLVIALGTNDRAQPAVFAAQVRRAKALAKGSRLVWVNAYSEVPPSAATVNRVLATTSGLTVVGWDQAARASQKAGRSPYVHDGVHPTPLGCHVRNTLIRRTVR